MKTTVKNNILFLLEIMSILIINLFLLYSVYIIDYRGRILNGALGTYIVEGENKIYVVGTSILYNTVTLESGDILTYSEYKEKSKF